MVMDRQATPYFTSKTMIRSLQWSFMYKNLRQIRIWVQAQASVSTVQETQAMVHFPSMSEKEMGLSFNPTLLS